ncbi:retrovirus-related pol polyprotein from transposon TNT 1-94 [Tanacetum coccineum]|uniref:Retrovirus-related pol polyprotein from transposon TNT 1-94 n=1 Tax=Tanacetum coccineum TaxID=301880 RepID=A0ABQ4XRJ9_9ASTR
MYGLLFHSLLKDTHMLKWVFRNKKYKHGITIKDKVRLVAQGYSQEEGIDYDETFAPVAMMEAIRIFLAFATYINFIIFQMDVKSAFLNGKLKEEVYVKQALGFESSEFPNYVCKLDKSLYGLKQAPRACSLVKTPMVPPNNLGPDLVGKPVNEISYRGMIRLLMYLTVTRPNIQFSTVLCARYQSNLKELHLIVVKRILKYLKVAMSSAEAEYVAAAGCCANAPEEHLDSDVEWILMTIQFVSSVQIDSKVQDVHILSKTKMSERLGTIKPINYAELNALYSHFVPQKELSREQDQLQRESDTIRNLQTQINITRMLNVGSTVGSFDKQALETELTQLKDAITSVRIQNDGFKRMSLNTELSGKKSSGYTPMETQKPPRLQIELLKENDLIEKVVYDKLLKSYSTLEKHCICLELTTQLNQEVFQKDNFRENQNAPTFNQLFELNELKAQSQEKDTVIRKLKDRITSLSGKDTMENVKKDIDEIETINIELEHNQFDSIRKTRVQSKEHCDSLIAQINAKSVENSDLNAQLQEKIFAITTLKNELRKLKGKNVVDTAVSKPNATIAPGMFKLDIEPISHRLQNNRDAHEVYIEKTIENTDTLRGFVERARTQNPSEPLLKFACMFTKNVQELLVCVSQTCPNSPKPSKKLVVVTPMNKDKKVRFAEPVTSLSNIAKQTNSLKTKDSNKPLLTSTGVKPTTSARGSKPLSNTKNNRITRPPSSNQKNKVEDHSRKVKSSLNKTNSVSEPVNNALVKHSIRNAKFESICAICNKCLFDANHDMCIIDYVNDVNVRSKSKSKRNKMRKVWKPTGKVFSKIRYSWKPTGRTFTIVGDRCPLTRITSNKIVPPKETTIAPVVTPTSGILVYSRRPKATRFVGSSSKVKIVKSKTSNSREPKQSWGSTVSDVPSSSLNDCSKFLGTVFGNDHIAKIMGYGDYQMGNVTISWVYYVEGLSHNLFFVGQFCDSNLEVAFRKHTCFIRDLDGVDLLKGSRGSNLYTLSMDNLLLSSPICLLLKASKTKYWLWHQRLSHLNFDYINSLAKHGLFRGLPKIKYQKDHLCYACALGKSKKHSHKPKAEDSIQEKLYLLHMDLCGPIRVQSINGRKYILVIVDDFSRFTWVKFLHSKDEVLEFVIKFLKMIEVRLNTTVRNIRTHNGTEFVNQTLRDYYEEVGISHQTSVARTSQQNGVVERQNRTLVEAARTMLIFSKALLFLWAEAYLNPPPCDDPQVLAIIAPEPIMSTGTPLSTTIDQDAPPISTSQTPPETPSPVIPLGVDEADHDIEVHMDNNPFFDAFLSFVEPKSYKDALTESCWIEAMQEELNEFERLKAWELVPRPDCVMVTLKWIYKVKLDELGGVLKNKACLVARGYRQEEGIDFEESFASVA